MIKPKPGQIPGKTGLQSDAFGAGRLHFAFSAGASA